jgi:hypothetical protein
VKLAYRLGNNGPQLEITSEGEEDSAVLREFGQAAIENDSQLRMERVSWETSEESVRSITVGTVPPPSDSMGTFPVGYSVHGWADHYVDQAQSGTVQWDYEFEVRPPLWPRSTASRRTASSRACASPRPRGTATRTRATGAG